MSVAILGGQNIFPDNVGASYAVGGGSGWGPWSAGVGGPYFLLSTTLTVQAPGGSSSVLVQGGGSGYTTAAPALVYHYLWWNGDASSNGYFYFNLNSVHSYLGTMARIITGVTPGTYTYGWGVTVSSGNLFIDSNDRAFTSAIEVP